MSNESQNTEVLQIEKPQHDELLLALEKADYILTKRYQYDLNQCPVIAPSTELINTDITNHIRLLKVRRIAYDKNEDNLAKLSNVYNALSAVAGTLIIIIESDEENVDFYIGTRTANERDINIAFKTLIRSLKGNFPGCVIDNLPRRKIERTVKNIFEYKNESSNNESRVISAVSGIPSMRNVAGNKEKMEFTQGIEKFIDSMRGETYTAVFLADPVSQDRINIVRHGYEKLYTQLVPFSGNEMSLSYTSGNSFTDTITKGTSKAISESLSESQSHTHTTSISETNTDTVGFNMGGGLPVFNVGTNFSSTTAKSESTSDSETKGTTITKGETNTESFSEGFSAAVSEGKSTGMQFKTEDKSITSLMERIDKQLKRLSECGDLGMWNCAAYFIADDLQTSKAAASTYQALIRGEDSGLEAITINTWKKSDQEIYSQNYPYVNQYLHKFCHPNINIGENLPIVTPTALVSGAELTIQAGLPQKSVPGLAVANYAAFGREIQLDEEYRGSSITLGNVFHMGEEEKGNRVLIDMKSLSGHTFVTGSTGSGKSNSLYVLLEKVSKNGIPFMVIEPAKGEYKDQFGNRDDVRVFGTNIKKSELLRINPFSFPEDIHVLEHIDRLIEIFNVCWPMYAAMPAVLKDAIERAYINSGWNLDISECKYASSIGKTLYPNFEDVLNQIYLVMDSSGYSDESKGNYIGALCTRVRSLTNGLYGQIFTSSELSNEELYDNNVIIDLSRVGSTETKALVMGLLVMKMQEYRMAYHNQNNADLRHITVLEEAHNLLKKTSSDQSMDGSNLLGKSVEMLANSIAEMRTYGEGFIIADQAPGLLDMAVIRNTNTKIILRLPDMSDRELVGRAASLNDDQIIELSKLKTGVAAVYQNNWLEPVLCKVERCKNTESKYVYNPVEDNQKTFDLTEIVKYLLMPKAQKLKWESEHIDELKQSLYTFPISTETKIDVLKYAEKEDVQDIQDMRCHIIYNIFNSESAISLASLESKDIKLWRNKMTDVLIPSVAELDDTCINKVITIIAREHAQKVEDQKFVDLCEELKNLIRLEGEVR